jgi:hypothetical protein
VPTRVVIHAGFHKTGTTSIQKTLRENRTALEPEVRIVLRAGMVALCEAARGYSQSKSPLDLGLVQFETAELLQRIAGHNGLVLISSEDLSGHMPGRRGLKSYAAAPMLMQAIAGAAAEVLPDTKLSFIFTTRAADPWLHSCYVQHLRATRITQSAQEYAASHRASAQLDKIVLNVAKALPDHDIAQASLEDFADSRLGPLDAVLDHAGVSTGARRQIISLPPANTSPPQAKMDKLLELNRSKLTNDELRAAKKALNRQQF